MTDKIQRLIKKNASRVRRAGALLWEVAASNVRYTYSSDKKIYAEIEKIRRRYVFQLLNVLSFTDYEVHVGVGPGTVDKYVRQREGFRISDANNHRSVLTRPAPRDEYIFLSDQKRELSRASGWKKKVYVDDDCFEENTTGFPVPFGVHPAQVLAGRDRELGWYRAQDSEATLLFAGACQPGEYATDEITDLFGKVPRNALYDMLRRILEEEDYTTTRNPERFLGTDGKVDAALFVLSDGVDNRVAKEEWLRVLAAADFFVAGPGVYMPMSHNAIEALAVGTIPIIEYPELFAPDLSAAGACVPFSGRKEFEEQVRSCLAMDRAFRKELKRNAREYYDTHLAPKEVGKALQRKVLDPPLEAPDKMEKITVIAGHESANVLKAKSKKTHAE